MAITKKKSVKDDIKKYSPEEFWKLLKENQDCISRKSYSASEVDLDKLFNRNIEELNSSIVFIDENGINTEALAKNASLVITSNSIRVVMEMWDKLARRSDNPRERVKLVDFLNSSDEFDEDTFFEYMRSVSFTSQMRESVSKCMCNICKGKVRLYDTRCPHNRSYNPKQLSITRHISNESSKDISNALSTINGVCEHNYYNRGKISPSESNSSAFLYLTEIDGNLHIKKIAFKASREKDCDQLVISTEVMGEIVVDKNGSAQCKTKTGKITNKYIDMLNITGSLFDGNSMKIYYDDAKTLKEFISKHERIMSISGIKYLEENLAREFNMDSSLIAYLYIYLEYPAIEKLIKMGFMHILNEIIIEIKCATSKREIARKMELYSDLFITDSTEGNKIIAIPKYIKDYLILAQAGISSIKDWKTLCGFAQISERDFNSYIEIMENTPCILAPSLSNINWLMPIMAHDGYTFLKTVKYVKKMAMGLYGDPNKSFNGISGTADILSDYLNMADMLNIDKQLYPYNLEELHDELSEAHREMVQKDGDKLIKACAEKCMEKIGKPKIGRVPTNKDKSLIVMFPRSARDLVDEASQQANCVASYGKAISEGRSVIFFIRRAETPEKSYVTCEYSPRRNSLSQCYQARNTKVYDKEVISFANEICKKLAT